MPTQRAHGGAQLFNVPLTAPGFRGLNTQVSATLMPPDWATVLNNAVVDRFGRVASRKGFDSFQLPEVSLTLEDDPGGHLLQEDGSSKITLRDDTTGIPGGVVQTFEYLKGDGTTEQITTSPTKIYSGTDDPTSNEITGVTFTAGNWQFMNFNDLCIGVQQGYTAISYNGSGNFGSISSTPSGTTPQGNCGTAAFGRLWLADADKQTIKYSGLLDHDDFGSEGAENAGSIDMTSVWPAGMDEIVNIVEHNGRLVVFGKHQIIFWSDSSSSLKDLGLNPLALEVVDTVRGVGLISRDCVQNVKGDLWFLSEHGVVSLGRLVQEKSAPMTTISTNVQDILVNFIRATSAADITNYRTVFSPRDRFFLLSMPAAEATFCFDTGVLLEDGTARTSIWDMTPTALAYTRAHGIVLNGKSDTGLAGHIGTYDGYVDGTSSYVFDYESGWLAMGEADSYLKMLKRISVLVATGGISTIKVKWGFDFDSSLSFSTQEYETAEALNEWGVMEWGLGEWAGGQKLKDFNIPANGTGQYIKLGVSVNIYGSAFGVQKLDLISKVGRLAA